MSPGNTSAGLLSGLLDLWIVLGLVVLTGVSVFYFDPGTLPTVTLLLVILFMFLLPGYALISAVQPRRPERGHSGNRDRGSWSIASPGKIGLMERLVLAVGVSLGVATATGFVLDFTGIGIEPEPASAVLMSITIIGCLVAAVRRYRLRPESRFGGGEVVRALAPLRGLFVRRSAIDLAITSVIVVSLIVGIAGTAFIAVSVDDRQSYTGLAVLSTNGSGDPVAAEYPSDQNGSKELLLELTNREHQSMNYTLIVEQQRVEDETVVESQERDRFRIDLPPNGEWRTTYPVPPDEDASGERLVFLLYVDSPPNDPDRENAYRAVHVWLDTPEGSA